MPNKPWSYLTNTVILLCVISSALFFTKGIVVEGATIDELKQKIEERNQVIKQLEKEISLYQNRIGETTAKAKTLQNKLLELDQTIKKLQTELSKTEANITKTSYTIEQLRLDIGEKEDSIRNRERALRSLVIERNQQESNSLLEQVLLYSKLSDAWNYYQESIRVQDAINKNVAAIKDDKTKLEGSKRAQESQKKNFQDYKAELSDQQKLVEQTKQEQNKILSQTKSTEATYRKQLAARLAQKTAFEKELKQFESDLKLAIDPKSIPKVGSGVLGWPLNSIKLTQEFGDTAFSRQHVSAYNGNGHNGVDFAASVGSVVKSAADGRVVGTGDTDVACPGTSYGRWVLIEHANGLSTLYAHLSLIKVTTNQKVTRGELIAYSGNTGYTTGPHLHFTVYATQGVRVLTRQSKVCGASYTMPIADLKAYLNPLLYL